MSEVKRSIVRILLTSLCGLIRRTRASPAPLAGNSLQFPPTTHSHAHHVHPACTTPTCHCCGRPELCVQCSSSTISRLSVNLLEEHLFSGRIVVGACVHQRDCWPKLRRSAAARVLLSQADGRGLLGLRARSEEEKRCQVVSGRGHSLLSLMVVGGDAKSGRSTASLSNAPPLSSPFEQFDRLPPRPRPTLLCPVGVPLPNDR